MSVIVEKELTFTFPAGMKVEHFDQPGVPLPAGIKPVDFVVDLGARLVLVEIKDPSHSLAPEKERAKFVRKMQSDQLTHTELAPKARTTYGYLHLMARDDRPMDYYVAIGTEHLSVQPPLLMHLTDRLRSRLRQEAAQPWVRQYIDHCMVVDVRDLPRLLPGVSVQRTPTVTP